MRDPRSTRVSPRTDVRLLLLRHRPNPSIPTTGKKNISSSKRKKINKKKREIKKKHPTFFSWFGFPLPPSGEKKKKKKDKSQRPRNPDSGEFSFKLPLCFQSLHPQMGSGRCWGTHRRQSVIKYPSGSTPLLPGEGGLLPCLLRAVELAGTCLFQPQCGGWVGWLVDVGWFSFFFPFSLLLVFLLSDPERALQLAASLLFSPSSQPFDRE